MRTILRKSLIRTLAVNQDIKTRLRNDINAELPVDYDVANLKALLIVLAAYVSERLRIHSVLVLSNLSAYK